MPDVGTGITPSQVDLSSVVAMGVVLVAFILAIVVAAWQPEHFCAFKNGCPHYRVSQERIEKRAAAKKARDDFFNR